MMEGRVTSKSASGTYEFSRMLATCLFHPPRENVTQMAHGWPDAIGGAITSTAHGYPHGMAKPAHNALIALLVAAIGYLKSMACGVLA